MDHARAVETLSRDAGDRLGALAGVTQQVEAYLMEHGERPAIAILRPALEGVADLGSTPEVVFAQAELARALMIGGFYEESVEYCDRVIAAVRIATDIQLTEALVTKGTALTNTPRVREGEIILRGAIQVAERLGYNWTALRARNNLLGVVASEATNAAAQLLAESYAIANRFGLRTWAVQFASNALSNAFERGDWDAWIEETSAFDSTGFYGAWRMVEHALRDAFRGRLDEARREHQAAIDMAGSSSSQAMTSMATVGATISFAGGDWRAVMPGARIGWSHQETLVPAVVAGMAAGVAANEAGWVAEAAVAIASVELLGRQADAERIAIDTALAVVEQRWNDARSLYVTAERGFSQSGAEFWLAMLNLAVGARAEGRFPEAANAAAEADAFFTRVGAKPFLDTYRAAFVPSGNITSAALPTAPEQGVRSS